jgi:pimeloyl-ACP methyl ester carboxylesterase
MSHSVESSIRPWLTSLAFLWMSFTDVNAQRSTNEASLSTAAGILAKAREIPEGGIQRLEPIKIGAISQWISVRGRNKENPLLLFLHGGPGYPMMPASYTFQSPWEEYFTVVQWDQRGAGKTYAANDSGSIAPTMTLATMISDAEQVVTYLRHEYRKRKIILMGHSWGSLLGVELVRRHPEWFHVYVGLGQIVDMPESERLGYHRLLVNASRTGNGRALEELKSIAPYPEAGGLVPTWKLRIERNWVIFYRGYMYGTRQDPYPDIVRLSPDYSEEDVRALEEGITFSTDKMWQQVAITRFWSVSRLDCPVVLFHGVHDLITSPGLARTWYQRLRAPKKKMVWFDHSAHMVLTEEPGEVFLHLVTDVRPFAAQER